MDLFDCLTDTRKFSRAMNEAKSRSKLPKDWRERIGYPNKGRFYLDRSEDGWLLCDAAYGTCLAHDTKAQAQDAMRLAKEYVKVHGDIDFCSFPWSLDQELHYDCPSDIDARWA